MNDIFFLNVVWILASFLLLYYGISGDRNDLIHSFVYIFLLFLLIWYAGTVIKQKEFEKSNVVFGDKVLGQWDGRK